MLRFVSNDKPHKLLNYVFAIKIAKNVSGDINDYIANPKQIFPKEPCDQSILKSVQLFSFPDRAAIESRCFFTFVIGNPSTDFQVGFVLYYTYFDAYCVLSDYYYPDMFSHLMSLEQSEILSISSEMAKEKVYDLYEKTDHFIIKDKIYQLDGGTERQQLIKLLFSTFPAYDISKIIIGMLSARHVFVVAGNASTCSLFAAALPLLIEPFYWDLNLIPILPLKIIEMIDVPVPAMIGITRSELLQTDSIAPHICVNCDTRHVLDSPVFEQSNISLRLEVVKKQLDFHNQINLLLNEWSKCPGFPHKLVLEKIMRFIAYYLQLYTGDCMSSTDFLAGIKTKLPEYLLNSQIVDQLLILDDLDKKRKKLFKKWFNITFIKDAAEEMKKSNEIVSKPYKKKSNSQNSQEIQPSQPPQPPQLPQTSQTPQLSQPPQLPQTSQPPQSSIQQRPQLVQQQKPQSQQIRNPISVPPNNQLWQSQRVVPNPGMNFTVPPPPQLPNSPPQQRIPFPPPQQYSTQPVNTNANNFKYTQSQQQFSSQQPAGSQNVQRQPFTGVPKPPVAAKPPNGLDAAKQGADANLAICQNKSGSSSNGDLLLSFSSSESISAPNGSQAAQASGNANKANYDFEIFNSYNQKKQQNQNQMIQQNQNQMIQQNQNQQIQQNQNQMIQQNQNQQIQQNQNQMIQQNQNQQIQQNQNQQNQQFRPPFQQYPQNQQNIQFRQNQNQQFQQNPQFQNNQRFQPNQQYPQQNSRASQQLPNFYKQNQNFYQQNQQFQQNRQSQQYQIPQRQNMPFQPNQQFQNRPNQPFQPNQQNQQNPQQFQQNQQRPQQFQQNQQSPQQFQQNQQSPQQFQQNQQRPQQFQQNQQNPQQFQQNQQRPQQFQQNQQSPQQFQQNQQNPQQFQQRPQQFQQSQQNPQQFQQNQQQFQQNQQNPQQFQQSQPNPQQLQQNPQQFQQNQQNPQQFQNRPSQPYQPNQQFQQGQPNQFQQNQQNQQGQPNQQYQNYQQNPNQ